MMPFYHQRGPVHTEDLIRRILSLMARVLALQRATQHPSAIRAIAGRVEQVCL
jgi:hypothetical protein